MATGSGLFIDNDGYVLTNVHVVNGCKSIAVKALHQPPVPGVIEALDPKNDLALVRIREGYGAPVTFRSQSRPARLGENVMAMGYPLFGILSNEPKATFGQVNSVAGINNDYTLLQVSAPVQPGNSGGPVMDESGMVLGVVVSELSPQVAARIGVVPQNVNFAIRGELAQIFMTAHGVPFAQEASGHRLRNDEIAAKAEAATAQVFCMKS
jgi:S1-C subfamily serine protease